jgi:hypothetical protein
MSLKHLQMDGTQLKQIVLRDALTSRKFINVFAANELPYWMPSQTMAIVNCCDRKFRGQHWLALSMEGCRLEIFDSFGLHPSVYNLMDKLPDFSVMTYNDNQLQPIHSNLCGYYCLFFCHYKARGFEMGDILSKFSNDYANNDKYIYDSVHDLFNL